ncbi:sulfotransferase [Actinoplanes sp. TBRC 11911]|uniref:sulfotransferase family protein n=1 Tax=Actinoplanes sp. TBRC 11911 TaxID=2729386 RepID=UPI00145FC9FE|nr:sulfotransferase [Actinoplanes sp. TBRC 11911]NMO57384.1 sulfotransferase [Actinoplanes sp. TBRC 11911]
MSSDRPIFVVGCPRSGTTMVQLMLHAHARIAIPPESRFLLTAYARRHTWGDLRDESRRRALADWIVATPSFGDLGLDPGRTAESIVAAPPTLGSAVGTVFRLYAQRFGKPRWGDKRPAYLRHLPEVLRLFPDAQIINIVRDGRDCVASLKEAPWRPREFGELVDFWARSADATLRARRIYPPDVYHQIRYEDLVADPERHLRVLCEFLGEDYDPAMAEPSRQAAVAVPEYKTWHTRTHQAVTTERVRSWQERLTAEEIAVCESVFGARLERFGYERSAAAKPDRVAHAWLAARDRLGPVRRLAGDVIATVRTGNRVPEMAARLTTGQRESQSSRISMESTRSG